MDDNEPFSSSPASHFPSVICPYDLLFQALSLIPVRHYIFALLLAWILFLYNFLEFHFLENLFLGFFTSRVNLVYNPDSPVYHGVVARCRILLGRYVVTPWLSSPHFQTCFLNFSPMTPAFKYRRQLFHASDGGTIALDWLTSFDVLDGALHKRGEVAKDDMTPIAVVVPGLTSDSSSAYLRHLAFNTAKNGWHVVVSNHRGLGGVSVTSDCFYNAGWTEDVRVVIDYLHSRYPMAPLFAIGASIGANILVKYLGEEGEKTPVAGAVAICSPWDLLIGDRFICRRLIQKLYDRALTIGLQGYAELHKPLYARLANWEGISKSRSIRDFDNHATCHVGKFETVDTYYRRCSSAQYVGNVKVPLLCVSALDDPLCTKEAIPWDECRANKNIVLATTKHGGHLAFFEGLTGTSLWWVRATNEFLSVLLYSRCMHAQKLTGFNQPKEPSIDQGPYLNVGDDGLVAAINNEQDTDTMPEETEQSSNQTETIPEDTSTMVMNSGQDVMSIDKTAPMTRSLKQLCRLSRRSIWLLGYIAVVTTFPFLGSFVNHFFNKKRRSSVRL